MFGGLAFDSIRSGELILCGTAHRHNHQNSHLEVELSQAREMPRGLSQCAKRSSTLELVTQSVA
jgi:hypothetical protein